MMYEEFIFDFAQRTYRNLVLIETQASFNNPKAYEVTQLINSFIGLLIFPKECYYQEKDFPGFPSPALEEKCGSAVNTYPNQASFYQLIRHLRNAVAHYRITAEPDRSGREIIGQFKFIDHDFKTEAHFEIVLDLADIRAILLAVLNYVGQKNGRSFEAS